MGEQERGKKREEIEEINLKDVRNRGSPPINGTLITYLTGSCVAHENVNLIIVTNMRTVFLEKN